MKILKNEQLAKYTTVKIGGTAKELVIPETTEELIQVVKERKPKYIISGGSNLLIAEHEYEMVVLLREFDTTIEAKDETFVVGASVRLQKLINMINSLGFGGIEYLYSVPGLVGGAVVMNAGRGKTHHKVISDFIISVEVIDRDGERIVLSKDECKFCHRSSIFKNNREYIISSITFKFPRMDEEETSKLKRERIALCKEHQDSSHPNFGSVFCENSFRIMKFARKHQIGSGNVHFSGKTANWILKEKGGTYQDAVCTIRKVELLHKLFFKKCVREVIVWD